MNTIINRVLFVAVVVAIAIGFDVLFVFIAAAAGYVPALLTWSVFAVLYGGWISALISVATAVKQEDCCADQLGRVLAN